uniref:Uncharacterized protein n=1 Tax=Tetranychus urticae TaxID=32264 RepID=T1K3I5_TETUR
MLINDLKIAGKCGKLFGFLVFTFSFII